MLKKVLTFGDSGGILTKHLRVRHKSFKMVKNFFLDCKKSG